MGLIPGGFLVSGTFWDTPGHSGLDSLRATILTSVPISTISSHFSLPASWDTQRCTTSSVERTSEESGSGPGFFDFRTILYHFVPP